MDFLKSFEKLSTVQLTCSEGALFPIHGNEECAINWALPGGGSAQQKGGKEDSTMLQSTLNYLCYTGMGKLRGNLIFIGKMGHCCSKDRDMEWMGRQEKNSKLKIPHKYYIFMALHSGC